MTDSFEFPAAGAASRASSGGAASMAVVAAGNDGSPAIYSSRAPLPQRNAHATSATSKDMSPTVDDALRLVNEMAGAIRAVDQQRAHDEAEALRTARASIYAPAPSESWRSFGRALGARESILR